MQMADVVVTPAPVSQEGLDASLARVRDAQRRATAWLVDRIGDDGAPEGADVANSWWRAPWALAVSGAPDAASAMLGWIERNALTDDGDLRLGACGGDAQGSPVYMLSPIAIAAWLTNRYDTARRVMDRLEHWTDPESGGAYQAYDFAADRRTDLLKTGQLGISALVTGRRDVADGVHRWLESLWAAQPSLPGLLYTHQLDGRLVTEFDPRLAVQHVVDFARPSQMYFYSGIAAAFLAGWAGQTGDSAARALGADYLRLNMLGTSAQFDDTGSVQICKFGWGLAAMHPVDSAAAPLEWLVKMADWFVDRQDADGSWVPSAFMAPNPGLLDRYWKTAEHTMELAYIEDALRATPAVDAR